MRLKSNEELFEAWKTVAYRVELLGSIVQNDMEIADKDVGAWANDVGAALEAVRDVANRTYNYINGGQ